MQDYMPLRPLWQNASPLACAIPLLPAVLTAAALLRMLPAYSIVGSCALHTQLEHVRRLDTQHQHQAR